MTTAPISPIRVRVHEPGDRRLDGILRLIVVAGEAGGSRPLADVLATLCREIAVIVNAPVVSVYLANEDGLVLAGNVGFPPDVIGRVKLAHGEGLTGFVAECLRPVSVAIGRHDERYKHVPGIGEEQFPAYLGVPLLGGGGALGVLVVQRREAREIAPADVALAAALAAPVSYAVERAGARAEARATERRRGGASSGQGRTARLTGRPLAPGVALGRADVLPALAGLEPRGETRPGHAVALALAGLARELGRARKSLEARGELGAEAQIRLRTLVLLLEDLRFRDLVVARCGASGVARGLEEVAREYARASNRPQTDEWLRERTPEVDDLCLLVGARAARNGLLLGGGVLVAERLTGVMALCAIARRSVAVVVEGPVEESTFGASLARAAGLPVVGEVGGLFAWARPEDRMLVDGDTGVVRVNPPPTAVARLRALR